MTLIDVLVVICGLWLFVMGVLIGRSRLAEAKKDADLLAFIEQAEYSLQCLPGISGDDPQWAVTTHDRVVGQPSFEIRDAIRSAAGDTHFVEGL